jgi:hypothetical protein
MLCMMGSLKGSLEKKVDCAGIQGGMQSWEVCQYVMQGFSVSTRYTVYS